MTKREQVLIYAMAAATLWGGASVGLGYAKSHRVAADSGRQKSEIRSFAETHRMKLATLRLSVRERQVLDEAAAVWADSPFIDRAAEALAIEAVQRFVYTGFIQIGKQQFAIVNGREYQTAQVIATTDFQVESIQPDHVVLVSGSGGRRMTIALQTSSEEKKESP